MKKNKEGRCYERAFKFLSKMSINIQKWHRLIHGRITGISGAVKGTKFGHAWIETKNTVIDPSSNLRSPRFYRKKDFYSAYKVDTNSLKRYTMNQAYKIGFKMGGHYGPWEK